MKPSNPRTRLLQGLIAIVLLAIAAVAWVEAVEHWIGMQLRSLAEAHLVPSFDFDDLTYRFPSTITLYGARLTSHDPGAPGTSTEILSIDSLTLLLTEPPRPNSTFRVHRLDLERPMLRIVRIPVNDGLDEVLGFSHLLKDTAGTDAKPTVPPVRPSARFEVRRVSLDAGGIEYDPRDGTAAIMLIDEIGGKLRLQEGHAGSYGLDLALAHEPIFTLALRATLEVHEKRLDIEALSAKLKLAREQDRYLTPRMQKLVAAREITGVLSAEASGVVALDDDAATNLQARFELVDAGATAGNYGLTLDRVDARISAKGRTMTIEKLSVDTLGGHAGALGSIELEAPFAASLHFEGEGLQIGELLRNEERPKGTPAFEGLLTATVTLQGPLAEIDRRAGGKGRASLRKARLGRIPVLSKIDEALDAIAEAAMKREHVGHDSLSLELSLDGDRARIENLRLNSRWYGLRGHGDVGFDSQLALMVQGGPIQRLENELGAMGEVLGEITATLLRAKVEGTLSEPQIGIEVLRQPLHK